jgi:hypothetical protein
VSGVETIIVVIAIMAYSVGRQIVGEPLRIKRLIGLPAALTVMGIVDVVNSKGAGPTRLDIILILAGCAVNAVIGLGQGRLMNLESRSGYLWGQMPKSVLWWWGAKIASGVILDGIGHALGAGIAVTSAVMLLRLGVNRLGQAAVVAPRALASGIPFAPEPTKHQGGSAWQPSSGKDRLLTDRRYQASTLADDGAPTSPSRYEHVQRGPDVSPPPDGRSGYGSGPSGSFVRSPTRPTSFRQELAQLLLREINNRISDTPK